MKNMDRKRTLRVVGGMLAVAAMVFVAVGVYGRYVYGKSGDGTAAAEAFYFTSDYLSTAQPTYTLPAGTTSVSFSLRNYADSLRVSELDISYAVYVNGVEKSGLGGTLTGSSSDTETITITLDPENDKHYEIQVVGSAGYVETLYATFDLDSTSTSVYWHLDTSNAWYVTATVWTYNAAGNVSIEVPDNLIPDNTDPAMASLAVGGDLTDGPELEKYSSRSFRFFKPSVATSVRYQDFTVTVGGTTAVHSAILQ